MRARRVDFNKVNSEIILLDGGLNENVSSLELKGGELIKCKNYQHVLGSQGGYKSIAGYERYDGRTKPSAIGASVGNDSTREAARSAINAVPGSGPVRGIHIFRGKVYAFRNDSGGTSTKMYVASSTGWREIDTSSDPLSPGGNFRFINYNFNHVAIPSATPSEASPSASPTEGSPSSSASEGTPSPGTPSSSVSSTPSSSVSSTPSGGTPSETPSEGTPSESTPSDTPSDTNTPSEGTPSSSPSEGTSSSSPSEGTPSPGTPSTSVSSTPSSSVSSTPSGGTPSGTPSASPSASPSEGTPSSSPSASPSDSFAFDDLEEMFFVDGINSARSFNGGRVRTIPNPGMGVNDSPINLTVHNERLWLIYPNGSLQYSNVGDPTDWSIGAGEIMVGGSITDLVSMVGNALVIFCIEGIYILNGVSIDDWQMTSYSRRSGSYNHTAHRLLGTVFFMDDRGVTSLESVDAFGDFESNTISQKVHNTLQTNKKRVTCATISRDLNQYRIFFSNNYSLWFSFQDKKLRGTTLTLYPIPVSRVTEGEDEDGNNVLFFSSGSTGYVYQMDSGTSFDGAEIEAALSTAYYHYKSPRLWKKFKTIAFEISTLFDMNVILRQDYDYSSVLVPRAGELLLSLSGTGQTWGSEDWGVLIYASGSEETNRVLQHVVGVGTCMNISLYSTSKYNQQHTIQNVTTDFEQIRRQF